MKKIIYILVAQVAAVALLSLTGCEREFDDPKPSKVYTDADFKDLTYITIADLKAQYADLALGQGADITDDYYIKGKVISNDMDGNVYRTMYIQDETAGIEIKIGTTANYNDYKVGQTLYVKVKHLYMGNYRYMLSLGAESKNADYANNYLDVKAKINRTIFKGEMTKLTSADTTVIRSYTDLNDGLLGSLVRIEGAVSTWGVWAEDNAGYTYPNFLEQSEEENSTVTNYVTYGFTETIEAWQTYLAERTIWLANGQQGPAPVEPLAPRPGTLLYPTYAFKNSTDNYYGSARFKFGSSDSDPTQNLIVRSSGYSKFALDPVPADGTVVNITAIYTKYSSRTGGYIKYQLLLNSERDVVVVSQ